MWKDYLQPSQISYNAMAFGCLGWKEFFFRQRMEKRWLKIDEWKCLRCYKVGSIVLCAWDDDPNRQDENWCSLFLVLFYIGFEKLRNDPWWACRLGIRTRAEMSGSLGLGWEASPAETKKTMQFGDAELPRFWGGPLFFLVGKTNCCLPQRTCRNLFRGLSDWRLALLLCYQKPEITICERAVNLFCRDGTFFLWGERLATGESFFQKVEEGPGICHDLTYIRNTIH